MTIVVGQKIRESLWQVEEENLAQYRVVVDFGIEEPKDFDEFF